MQSTARLLGQALLADPPQRVVFAESCTAGLAAAALAAVPGISQSLCGSLVTYREASKQAWLGVDPDRLAALSAVSPGVTEAMARGALERTAEANWSAAITGHLGPAAPADRDGIIYLAIARRPASLPPGQGSIELVCERREQLTAHSRVARQQQAAQRLLACLAECLPAR